MSSGKSNYMIEDKIKAKTFEAIKYIEEGTKKKLNAMHVELGKSYYALGEYLDDSEPHHQSGGSQHGIFGTAMGVQALLGCKEALGTDPTFLTQQMVAWLVEEHSEPNSTQNKVPKLSNFIIALAGVNSEDNKFKQALENSIKALGESIKDGGWTYFMDGSSPNKPDIVCTCHALLALKIAKRTNTSFYNTGYEWLLKNIKPETMTLSKQIVVLGTILELGINIKTNPTVYKIFNDYVTNFEKYTFAEFTFTWKGGAWIKLSKPAYLLKPFIFSSPYDHLSKTHIYKLYMDTINDIINDSGYRDPFDDWRYCSKDLELVKIFAKVYHTFKFESKTISQIMSFLWLGTKIFCKEKGKTLIKYVKKNIKKVIIGIISIGTILNIILQGLIYDFLKKIYQNYF